MPHSSRRGKRHQAGVPSQEQYRLPFGSRNERYALLDAIDHKRAGLTRTRWKNVRDYLKAVHRFDTQEQGCWASHRTLSEQSNLGRDALTTAKRDALELSLVTIEKRAAKASGRGRQTDVTRIDWRAVSTLGIDDADSRPRTTFSRPRTAFWRPRTEKSFYSKEEIHNEVPNELLTAAPPPTNAAPLDCRAGWAGVENSLREVGLREYGQACESARQRDCTPEAVAAVLRYWQPRRDAWGQYSLPRLYTAIHELSPGQAPRDALGEYVADANQLAARRLDETAAKQRALALQTLRERWQPTFDTLDAAQRQLVAAEAKRLYPPQPDASGRQIFSESVLPYLDAIGRKGLDILLDSHPQQPRAP